MPPIKLSKREINLMVLALLFAISYVFYQFLLIPRWEEIDKLKSRTRKLRMDLKIAENKVRILKSVQEREREAPEKRRIPVGKEEKALEVLRVLAQTTTKSRLKLITIKPMIGAGGSFKFDLTCRGTYKQLYDFLDILRGLDVLMLVDRLDVSGGGSKKPTLSIQMSLTAHF